MNAPFDISVRTNIKELIKSLDSLAYRQLPFATSLALNKTAKAAIGDVQGKMRSVFDRPTPFTLNSIALVKAATKNSLVVQLDGRRFGGTPAEKFLGPEAFGGQRNLKRFELRFSSASGGQFIVPGRGAQLDQFGNISRGQISIVLSRLSLLGASAQNIGAKTSRRLQKKGLIARGQKSDYFVARSKQTGKPLAVYQLVAKGHVEPVFVFTSTRPSYAARFPYDQTVNASVTKNFNLQMTAALDYAMATAKG